MWALLFWLIVKGLSEPPEQLPVELLSTGPVGRQQLADHKPFSLISLSNIRNHHPLLLPDVTKAFLSNPIAQTESSVVHLLPADDHVFAYPKRSLVSSTG